MRLWSLHPHLLDAKGLVALWREGLLAKAVLDGKTIGYRNHPQLDRFKACPSPQLAIRQYLLAVFDESKTRGYRFDFSRIGLWDPEERVAIAVTDGQVRHEFKHLIGKLERRDHRMLSVVLSETEGADEGSLVAPNFMVVSGEVEPWEKL